MVIPLKYEELFKNNFQKIRETLDNIGIEFTDDIFDNSKFVNSIIPGTKISDNKPKNIDHSNYRTWQINQPIRNMNGEIDLTYEQIERLKKMEILSELGYFLEEK